VSGARNIILVHGAFVDGSGWRSVYDLLAGDNFNVSVVQNPTVTLDGDVAATRTLIEAQDGPVVLVGHSYGGVVITEAGTHDKVSSLVYVAAFAPDAGESLGSLIADPPPGESTAPILPPENGFLLLDRERFAASFASDLPANDTSFMARSQVPLGLDAVSAKITKPAWREKPSWYLLTTQDGMIPPVAQRAMAERADATISDVASSHAVYISHPSEVAALIKQAALG
jgi:pimeloyl-ACP methyl ester carboxylesterase